MTEERFLLNFAKILLRLADPWVIKGYTSSLEIQAMRIRSQLFLRVTFSALEKLKENKLFYFTQMCIKPSLDRQMFILPHMLSFRCLVTDSASFDD